MANRSIAASILILTVAHSSMVADEPLPEEIAVGDTTYSLVVEPARDYYEGAQLDRIPEDYRLLTKNPQELCDDELPKWFRRPDSYLRSTSGLYALPWKGLAPDVGYIDIKRRRFVRLDKALPPLGDAGNYRCTGLCRHASEMRSDYLLFIQREAAGPRAYYMARIPFEKPDRISVEKIDYGVVYVYPSRDELAPVLVNPKGGDTTWGIISGDTGKLQVRGRPLDTYGTPDHAAISPDRTRVFVRYSAGLAVFDAESGQPIKLLQAVGRAGTFATAFDAASSVAAVVDPRVNRLTLIDARMLKVMAHYKTPKPLLGVQFDKRKRTIVCLSN